MITGHFGLTEGGKSWNVLKRVMPLWRKKVVFDYTAKSFEGDVVLTAPSDRQIELIAQRFAKAGAYSIVIRPDRRSDTGVLFEKTAALACALGRFMGKDAPANERVQLIVDEADFVCSPHYQSPMMKHVVNKGRHDNVDCHFIARNPNRLHTDIRSNCSKIVSFRLMNATSIPFFLENFSRKIAEKIQNLPKYHRIEWRDTGEIIQFDQNNNVAENFGLITEEVKDDSGSKCDNFSRKKRVSDQPGKADRLGSINSGRGSRGEN